MRAKAETISRLRTPGIIAVVRARRRDQVVPLAEALVAGGVRAIEITLTTPEPFEAIQDAHNALGDSAVVGVGTVLTADDARRALDAGAEFVVSPILRPVLVEACRLTPAPLMLGAYTPTEAQLAHEAGADFVKIFPADTLGPAYIKSLRAPMPHLRIVPTGGVDVSNVAQFMAAGCAAVGVGSPLMTPAIMEQNDWVQLERKAREFVNAIQRRDA